MKRISVQMHFLEELLKGVCSSKGEIPYFDKINKAAEKILGSLDV